MASDATFDAEALLAEARRRTGLDDFGDPRFREPMDRLLDALTLAEHPRRTVPATARWLLYLRSHWLRMPPLLLARHLGYKAYLRWRPSSTVPTPHPNPPPQGGRG